MAGAPPVAPEYLRANPHLWKEYRSKYGSLPSGFSPPVAPGEAVEYLKSNPDLMPEFEQKYGYRPLLSDANEPAQKDTSVSVRGPASLIGKMVDAVDPISDDGAWTQAGRNVEQLGIRSVARLGEGVAALTGVVADKLVRQVSQTTTTWCARN